MSLGGPPNSERGPEPGRLAALLPAGLGLTPQAWPAAGRVGPSFVVALGAAGLAGPVLALLTKRTPGELVLATTSSWLLPQHQRPIQGQAETAVLEWEPQGLARRQPSWVGGRWPLEGERPECVCMYGVGGCVPSMSVCVCVQART